MIHYHDLARLLLALEHDRMDRDTDMLFQSITAELASRVPDDDLAVRLERAALTCHHCREVDGG